MDGQTGTTTRPKRTQVRRGVPGNPCTIQDLFLEECLLGVKLAARSASIEDLKARLEAELPQNSPETRRDYAGRIPRLLFPDKRLDSAPLLAWRAYGDERILLDHFRVRYLEAVPLLGKFVTGPLASQEVGEPLDADLVRTFVSRECGAIIPDTVQRIPRNLSKTGFFSHVGKAYVRGIPDYQPISVILELHRIFAPVPTTIAFAEIAAHPFWRYVGVSDAPSLERILYWGVANGILAKFVKSDELNQVTTGTSYLDLLKLRPNPTSSNGRG